MAPPSTLVPTRLGSFLSSARHESGLRLEGVAVAIGKSVDAVRSYESGRRTPPLGVFRDLCQLYGLDVGEALEQLR